jgi:hypothetical protein
MKWLGLTVGLLCASLLLVGWVYLRDRDTSSWRPPEAQLARADARVAFAVIGGVRCRPGCGAQVIGQIQPQRWLVRLALRGRAQCLRIDVDTFATGPRGLYGIQRSRC